MRSVWLRSVAPSKRPCPRGNRIRLRISTKLVELVFSPRLSCIALF